MINITDWLSEEVIFGVRND